MPRSMKKINKDLYRQDIYKVIWDAHQKGEPWLSIPEIMNRVNLSDRLQAQGVELGYQDILYSLSFLQDLGYISSALKGGRSRTPIWRLTKHAIDANAETVGKPLGGWWKDCKCVRIPPAMANDERYKTMPMEELEKYAC